MQAVPTDSKQPRGTDAPSILTDYYGILRIKPGYSDIHLLMRFIRSCKLAMAAGDKATLTDIRRGFEVLRYEDTRIAYFRMHRVLVLHEPLRYPEAKKNEMLRDIRAKEELALLGSHPVVTHETGYGSLLFDVITSIVLLDLARIFPFGSSALLLLLGMLIAILVAGITWPMVGIGICFVTWAYWVLRARASDYVTYPEQVPFSSGST
jgi:hypothetical protein